jgi:hypothetical protein
MVSVCQALDNERQTDALAPRKVGDQMISPAELERLGLPKDSLKMKHPKTGEEGYRAAVEVFHQLHCLNLIRQAVYKDYYKEHGGDVGDADSKEDLQGHVGTSEPGTGAAAGR